jgi:holo-[acyl-carrier protein] synthase
MPILGHGIDLVDVERIAAMMREHGRHFLDRCFTPAEQAYCLPNRRAHEHFAGRFAAKEAILKALGTGWRGHIAWTDMEIFNDPAGRPLLRLSGETARLAATQRITSWHLSISHTDKQAIASAIAEG